MNRRVFLGSAGVLAAQTPSDSVRLAIIGLGGRGNALMREFTKVGAAQVAAVVDPDGNRAEAAAGWILKETGRRARVEADMRRVFEDKSIDAVVISTTNHWHALTAYWAMKAGKDVYVEKPVSHNFFEGVKLVEAARKYGRIVQGGTQRRSMERFRKIVAQMHGGLIGDIYLSKWVFPGGRDSIGFKPVEQPPNWLNWDIWLGPAPEQPYHGNLVHYNWHWFWDFGNGEMGNNGIHLVDIARWAMRKELPVKVHCWGGRFGYKDQAETPNTQTVTWTYDDGTSILGELRGLYTSEPMSWDFFGTKGHIHIDADGKYELRLGRNKTPEQVEQYSTEGNHYANFIEAVRTRRPEQLNAEIRETHLSTALCHLGNIAYRMNRELAFDPSKGEFVNDAAANRLLRRDYRPPYVIPDNV